MAKKKLSELTEKTTLHKDDLFYLVDSEVPTGKGKKVKYGTIRPYKVYKALLTQTGTNAPVATVLENTLGGTVVWTRVDTGIYDGVLSGAFVSEKLFFPNNNYYTSIPPADSIMLQISYNSVNSIRITVFKADTEVYNDDYLLKTPIEIQVYN